MKQKLKQIILNVLLIHLLLIVVFFVFGMAIQTLNLPPTTLANAIGVSWKAAAVIYNALYLTVAIVKKKDIKNTLWIVFGTILLLLFEYVILDQIICLFGNCHPNIDVNNENVVVF